MTNHDYLVLGIAILWVLTNFFGAAFTLRRVHKREKQAQEKRSFARLPRLPAQ